MPVKNPLYIALLVALGTFTVFVLFYNLGSGFLEDWDEAWYVLMARSAIQGSNYLHLMFEGSVHWDKPPFPVYPMIALFRLFGISETTARLSSAIFGLGIMVQLFLLARKFYGHTASILVLVIASTSAQWLFSHGIRSANIDSITLFFLISSLSAWLLIERDSYRIIATMASLAFLFLCKGPIVAIPLIPIAATLIVHRPFGRSSLKYFSAGLLVCLAIVVPWYLYMYLKFGDMFVKMHIVRNFFHRYATGIENHLNSPFYFLLQVSSPKNFIWFGPAGVAFVYSIREYIRKRRMEDLLLVSWAVGAFVIVNQSQTKLWWYIYPVYLPLIIMTARALADFIDKRDSLNSLACFAGIIFVLLSITGTGVFPWGATDWMKAVGVSLTVFIGFSVIQAYLKEYQRSSTLIIGALCLVPINTTMNTTMGPLGVQGKEHPILQITDRIPDTPEICAMRMYPGDVYYLSRKLEVRNHGDITHLRDPACRFTVFRTEEMRQIFRKQEGEAFILSYDGFDYRLVPEYLTKDYALVRVSFNQTGKADFGRP